METLHPDLHFWSLGNSLVLPRKRVLSGTLGIPPLGNNPNCSGSSVLLH